MRIERLIQSSSNARSRRCCPVAAFAATNGGTALVDAVKNQDTESARALLKQHVDVNARKLTAPRRCIGRRTGATWKL